jgi:hypothetical protein
MFFLFSTLALAGIPVGGPRGSFARPTLSGTVALVESEDLFFRVHYTTEGTDAVSVRDQDEDGIPDYPERVLAALELGRSAYADAGWRALIGDDGEGGSEALDVYLTGVDINGYAYAIDAEPDDPGFACFVEIDPQLTSAGLVLESVAVHELHHCVQYRYAATASWIHEGSATAEQYSLVSDLGLQLAVNVLWDTRLSQPELAIDDRTGRYEYAAFSFFKYWQEQVASHPSFWESIGNQPNATWPEQVEVASQDAGLAGFDDAYLAYSGALVFACGLDDGQHWGEDSLGCTTEITVPLEVLPTDANSLVSTHTDTPYTATYHELPAGGSELALQATCTASAGAVGVRLAAVDADGVATEEVFSTAGDVRLARPLDPDGAVRVIVASLGDTPAQASCVLTRVAPTERPDTGEAPRQGCSCQSTRSMPMMWLAPFAWLASCRRRRSTG